MRERIEVRRQGRPPGRPEDALTLHTIKLSAADSQFLRDLGGLAQRHNGGITAGIRKLIAAERLRRVGMDDDRARELALFQELSAIAGD